MSLKHSIPSFLLLISTPLTARAQDVKRECVDASTLGQTQRNDSQLLEARAQFLTCSREVCPEVVRNSCNRWLTEVEELTPSVVVRVSDANDSDLTEGTTSIDGVSYPLDGKTIPLNPGKHVLVVEAPNGVRVEKKVLLASGEKSRLIELRLDGGKRAEPVEPVAAPAHPTAVAIGAPRGEAPAADGATTLPTGAWVLGGVSLAAFGSFAFFAVSARSEYGKLKDACSPTCSNDQMRTGRTDALVADVSLGAGVAAIAGAVVWTLVARPSAKKPQASASIAVVPSARGGYAAFSTPF